MCPTCGVLVDAASGVTDESAIPKEGDFSICFACLEPAVFRDDQTLRAPTDAELIVFKKVMAEWRARQ
jgi:hypothetical protein